MRYSNCLSAFLLAGFALSSSFGMSAALGDEVIKAKPSDNIDTPNPVEGNAPEDSDSEEWKPQLIVTLFTTADGGPRQAKQTARVPYYTLSYQEVDRGGKKERVEVRELAYRDQEVTVATAGSATLFCDDFALSISKSGDAVTYGFECAGRLQLRFDGMILDCDSGKLTEGKLELVNARATHKGTAITSEKMTVGLAVKGVRTAEFGIALPPEAFELIPPGSVAPRIVADPLPASKLFPTPDDSFSSFEEPASYISKDQDRKRSRTDKDAGRSFDADKTDGFERD